jgi:hypothetical protein
MDTAQLRLNGIAELPLLDESGIERPISTLWQERRAALIFIRHFG